MQAASIAPTTVSFSALFGPEGMPDTAAEDHYTPMSAVARQLDVPELVAWVRKLPRLTLLPPKRAVDPSVDGPFNRLLTSDNLERQITDFSTLYTQNPCGVRWLCGREAEGSLGGVRLCTLLRPGAHQPMLAIRTLQATGGDVGDQRKFLPVAGDAVDAGLMVGAHQATLVVVRRDKVDIYSFGWPAAATLVGLRGRESWAMRSHRLAATASPKRILQRVAPLLLLGSLAVFVAIAVTLMKHRPRCNGADC